MPKNGRIILTEESSTLGGNHPRGVPITLDLAAKLSDKAWSQPGVTASDIVREALSEALVAGDISKWGDDPGNGPRRLAFYIQDEDWDKLKTLAFRHRISLAATVRIAVARKLGSDE